MAAIFDIVLMVAFCVFIFYVLWFLLAYDVSDEKRKQQERDARRNKRELEKQCPKSDKQ